MEYKGKPVSQIIVGLGYGDEGKGMAACFEAKRMMDAGLAPVVVRYNGGPQAAHNVRLRTAENKPLHHTFHQFGSGSLLKAKTILSAGMLVDLPDLIAEADILGKQAKADVLPWVTIDTHCPIVIPMHAQINQKLEEKRGSNRHGSTGRGIGIARTCETEWISKGIPYRLTVRALADKPYLKQCIYFWMKWCKRHFGVDIDISSQEIDSQADYLYEAYQTCKRYGVVFTDDTGSIVRDAMDDGWSGVVFEGSQGMLLDERYGYFPHVTYGDMTAKNAKDLADDRPVQVLGFSHQPIAVDIYFSCKNALSSV